MLANKENTSASSKAARTTARSAAQKSVTKARSKADAWIDPDEIPDLSAVPVDAFVLHRNGVPVKRGRPPVAAPKEAVSLRLDADVVAHYRATGLGWQSRINAALRKAARLDAKA